MKNEDLAEVSYCIFNKVYQHYKTGKLLLRQAAIKTFPQVVIYYIQEIGDL